MGGVDKCDHLISLYRIFIRLKKWTLRLITHGIDIAAVNSWIEYKKEAKSLGLHEKKILDLIHFRQYLAEALILSGKPVTKKKEVVLVIVCPHLFHLHQDQKLNSNDQLMMCDLMI